MSGRKSSLTRRRYFLDELYTGIRKALPTDAEDFATLVIMSAPLLLPTIYGEGVANVMQYLFCRPSNLISFEYTCFAEHGGRKAGMVLSYDWQVKEREGRQTGFLLFEKMRGAFRRKVPLLMKFENVIGVVKDREYYISNIAVYPEYRSAGIGTRLISIAEEEAKKSGAQGVVLDVEVENTSATRLYKRLGYSVANESTVRLRRGQSFSFYRMCKEL
jgi:ribosomal protein S18 acetylase RimI-like enzyme